jgi:hypothetical protein
MATVNAMASEVQSLVQTSRFRYGERTSPVSMMTNFRGVVAMMERDFGTLVSQQVK